MKVISLYCGAGGIDEGIKQAGHQTIIAIDNNKKACQTFKKNHPDTEVLCGNVFDLKSILPKADVIVAGPPCQGFSIANMKRTYDPTEINNFWQIVEKLKPKFFFMENVGNVIKVCSRTPNYLINFADYGIPQKRIRRIFTNIPLPDPTFDQSNWITIKEALGINGLIENRRQFNDNKKRGIKRRYHCKKPSITITEDTRLWLISDKKFQNIKFKTRKYFHQLDQPARTVTTKDLGIQPSLMVSDGYYARKLTNQELAILQGFSKDYCFIGGKTAERKQIGNALPPGIAKVFFEQI